jgi:hypothetical protein
VRSFLSYRLNCAIYQFLFLYLTMTTKEKNRIINDCYNAPHYHQSWQLIIRMITDSGLADYDLELVGRDNQPDCLISHFGQNFFFRTEAGINRKEYKTFGSMLSAIKKRIAKATTLEFVAIGYNDKGNFIPIC